MTAPPIKTGDIVLYHYLFEGLGRPEEATAEAAIVTCTHDDWSPGYHNTEGTWKPDTTVPQPTPGHVHMTVFYPTKATAPTVFQDVPHQSLAKAGESYWTAR